MNTGNINPNFNSSVFASTAGGELPGEYVPRQYQEVVVYEQLWHAANPSGGESLTGVLAVPFFQKSSVDNGILRQVELIISETKNLINIYL